MSRVLLLLCCAITLLGCQAPPNIQKLQSDKDALQKQLSESLGQVGKLEADKALLKQELAELNRVVGILGEEKSSRVESSTSLRGQVRQFVQAQIDGLKQFLLASDLLDYIGGELVERSHLDEKPSLVVDLQHSVSRSGNLTGVAGYFQNNGTVSVKVLRPVAGNFVVVWSSEPVRVTERGMRRLNFRSSVGVEKGDYLGYYFSKPGVVGYDTGTGNVRYLKQDAAVGASIKRSSLKGEKDRRAYSIGVLGLLSAS